MSDVSAGVSPVNYKQTLNLPRTSFPMKANLSQNEPQTVKRWQKMKLYDQILAKNEGREPFIFHDGPPYANGDIHVGHLLNKVLKDIVVRSQNMMDKYCPFVPGWDCHGLPIEHKVMTDILAEDSTVLEGLSDDERRLAIRKACANYAKKHIKAQRQQMQALLTLADYDQPYLTMLKGYEQCVLEVFSGLVKEGVVYRQLKPVHWSIANQTALAEAELEYYDKEDLSVFVTFESVDSLGLRKLFGVTGERLTSFMIWTTTPWTLPANLAVSVHRDFSYALVDFKSTVAIVAEDLVETVAEKVGVLPRVLGVLKGEFLLGQRYVHPFCDREGVVVEADYVTLDDGTGLVHTAPGHGVDDYQTGLREGLDVYCPVQADGTYDDSVPVWLRGRSIWEANTDIESRLKTSGHLFFSQLFLHSYPHDWRSKTPVIFRSTEQWFVGVDMTLKTHGKSLREMAIQAVSKDVTFVPEWGQNRLKGMLESRPDWCLSRQRSWGLPIPAFRDSSGLLLMTASSIEAIGSVFSEKGSDAWFYMDASALLSGYDISQDGDAPDGFDMSSAEKMYDIFDVWFESGSSWHAVLQDRELGYPAELYLEGSDQHRGWFHLSLLPALGVTGRAPYKALLTHGFMVDKDGRKMSKSSGNALNVEDILKQYGAEVTRWWVASLAYENDIKVDESYFSVAGDAYRKIRNTLRFLLSNLTGLTVSLSGVANRDQCLFQLESTSINAWVLSELKTVTDTVNMLYTRYKFREVTQTLYQFCNETLSAVYCATVKDRLYCDDVTSPRRIQTQQTLWFLLDGLLRLLAPILPHTSEEAYFALYGESVDTIHLQSPLDFSQILDVSKTWKPLLELRETVMKALDMAKQNGIDNPLDAELLLPMDDKWSDFVMDLSDLFGVSRIRLSSEVTDVQVLDISGQPRCERSWKRDETVKQRENGAWLSDRDYEVVR